MECAKYATVLHCKKGKKYKWKQFVQSLISFLLLDIIFFPANNFEAQIFLVIKNTQVVSCVLCSSFMHVLCNWHDAWIRPSKNLKTRNQMTWKCNNSGMINPLFEGRLNQQIKCIDDKEHKLCTFCSVLWISDYNGFKLVWFICLTL